MNKKYNNIFNLNYTIAKDIFENINYPWEVLSNIKSFITELGKTLDESYVKTGEDIWIHKTALIDNNVSIKGPCIIDEEAEIRHNAYIRGSVIIGKKSVVGNSSEIKNSILFDNAKCPHFNYVGDSILGESSHIGAGVILSNFKSDGSNIKIKDEDIIIDTRLRKFGAILGSNVEVGCNSVLFPGSIIFPNSNVYPLTRVRGIIQENKIVKDEKDIVDKEVR